MATPDRDLDHAALARLGHDELGAILSSLCARLGEAPLADSALRASTADELRARLRALRRRLEGRVGSDGSAGGTEDLGRTVETASLLPEPGSEPRPRGVGGAASGPVESPRREARDAGGPARGPIVPRRRVVAMVTTDDSLVEQARELGRGAGLVIVPVDSAADLRILVASVTPACVILDARGPPIDAALRQELHRRALPVRVGSAAAACLARVAAVR